MKATIRLGALAAIGATALAIFLVGPHRQPKAAIGNRARPTGPWSMTMLTAKNRKIVGDGVVPVHFTAVHRASVIGPYQFVVTVRDETTGETVEHAFDPYDMRAGEERKDEFNWHLGVPPGEYWVSVELRHLRPEFDATGQVRLSPYHGMGNEAFIVTVR
jgi:hypothetical protein